MRGLLAPARCRLAGLGGGASGLRGQGRLLASLVGRGGLRFPHNAGNSQRGLGGLAGSCLVPGDRGFVVHSVIHWSRYGYK